MNNTVLQVSVFILICGAACGILLWCLGSSSSDKPATLAGTTSADTVRPEIAGPVPTTITWQHDLDGACDEAGGQRGIVVVDVYTDWCGWCKKMDEAVYTDRSVAALGARDVFVKANAEDHGPGQAIARKFGVDRYPTTLLLDRNGKLLDTIHGYISPTEAFVRLIRNQEARAR